MQFRFIFLFSMLQVSNISARIAALKTAGLKVDPQSGNTLV